MKSIFSLIVSLACLQFSLLGQTLDPITIFSENFESPDALSQWQIAPNGGRVRIFQDPRDPANHGLLMDDPVNDANFTQNAVSKTISIAGYTDIHILVDILSFNDEQNAATNAFDGVRLRVGGKVLAYPTYWGFVMDIPLDPTLLNLALASDGLLTIELDQYDNFSFPDDGLFFDNVRVTGYKAREIVVEAPMEVKESDPFTVTVAISPVPIEPVLLQLLDGTPTVHGFATYPAGAAFAQLTFPSFDNNRLDGDRQTYLSISDGHSTFSFGTLIRDDEPAELSITTPETLIEGAITNGIVTIGAPHDTWLNVSLESSDPTAIAVQSGVGGFGPMSFQIYALDNRKVLPDREVTITARIGGETAQSKIKVIERNSLVPVISGVDGIAEGAQEQTYIVSMNGISDQPLTINLSGTPASLSINPATLTLPAGAAQAYFKVSVADDTDSQGDRPFTITAQNNLGQQSQFTGKILDNEITGFYLELPNRLQAAALYSVTVHAVNRSRSEVAGFSGTANIYLKDKSSGDEQLLDQLSFSQGHATVSIQLPYSANGASLVVRTADGISSISAPLVIFMKLAFGANDVIWDPKRQLFYASSSGSALPGHVQSVTPIDPSNGQIKDGLFLGGDPRKVVITDNGKYLYVGDWGSSSVKRIDLDTFALAASITLISDVASPDNTFVPYDLLALPGRPLDILVSQNQTLYPYHSTRLYVNGSMQLSNSFNAYQFAPGGSPDEFYSFDAPYSGSGTLMRFKLTSGGFNLLANKDGLVLGPNIDAQDDLVFSTGGRVANGKTMETVVDLKLPPAWAQSSERKTVMTPEIGRSRIYYAHGNSIAAFDTAIFQPAGDATIPGIGNIVKIVRWGDTGIALLTDKAELVVFHDDPLVPTGPPADVAVNISVAPQPIFVGGDLTYTATVENLATNTAHNVQLSFVFNAGQTIGAVDALGFPQTIVDTNLLVTVGDIAAGAKYEIHIAATPTAVATLAASVGALTSSLDSNYTNNKAAVAFNVGFTSAPNSVNVVKMNINDLATQPIGGNLVVSIGAAAPSGIANHVVTIDPLTGLIGKSIATPGEPTRLAVSDDGTVAYAISGTRDSAYQINLGAGDVIRTINFNTTNELVAAYDIKVLPGTTDSIIIGSSWNGARIYDKGVLRPQTSGTYQGMLIALLPDPKVAFGIDNGSALKYAISSTGVKTLTAFSGLYANALKGDAYYIYTDQGAVVRADLMITAGTFNVNSAFSQNSYGPAAVEPERALRRVYYGRENQIASFDSESYLPLRTATFGLPSRITNLERWGADGFAARLESGELAIIRTDLVPDAPSAIDLLVDVQDGIEVNQSPLTISGQAYHGQGIASVKIGDKLVSSSTEFRYWSGAADLAEGKNIITITATSLGAPADTRTITRTVTYTPSAAATVIDPTWITAHFGSTTAAQSGPNDDPDGDGQSNFAEFLFGTDPLTADKPQLHLQQVEGGAFAIQFKRRNTRDFDFVIEVSSDLATWQPVTSQTTDTQIAGADNYLSSTLQLPTASANQFCRIHAARK